jgi:hypothetical protein
MTARTLATSLPSSFSVVKKFTHVPRRRPTTNVASPDQRGVLRTTRPSSAGGP